MSDIALFLGITLAVVISAIMIARRKLFGPEGTITRAREQEARELEIKIKMSSGIDVVSDFNELARVYVSLNRLNDAESCMRKALSIAEGELGKADLTLIPILENYANVLSRMNRTVESDNMRKRACELRDGKSS